MPSDTKIVGLDAKLIEFIDLLLDASIEDRATIAVALAYAAAHLSTPKKVATVVAVADDPGVVGGGKAT
jgi:hypothetical protein